MSIIDSKEAFTEAKNVGKLTKLAFFFIPLTLVAGVFGMNIVVGIQMRPRKPRILADSYDRNSRANLLHGTG